MKRKITKRFVSIVCLVALTVAMVTVASAKTSNSPDPRAPWYGICTDNLNVRPGPSESSGKPLTSLANGSFIQIIGLEGTWYKVQYEQSGSTGYCSSAYLNISTPHNYLIVSASSGYMREAAEADAKEVASVEYGMALPYYGTVRYASGETWYAVVYTVDTGYLPSSFVAV